MKLSQFRDSLFKEIVSFNKKSFPLRKDVEQSFVDRFEKNPFSKSGLYDSAFIEDEEGFIHGQFLMMPTRFHYQNEEFDGHFGFDFILDESLRGKGMGKKLSAEVMKLPNYCVMGVSKASEALHFKFGNKELATAERFIKFRTFWSPLRLIFKKSDFDRRLVPYPAEILAENIKVQRIFDLERFPEKKVWNRSRLEWDRSNEFLQWRFLSQANKYAMYVSEKQRFYFVVRKVRWKSLNVLLLVDFRYDNESDFQTINKLAFKICGDMKCSAIISVTSLKSEKEYHKNAGFKKFGEPMQVMSTNDQVKSVEQVAATFADSDIDTFYGDNVW